MAKVHLQGTPQDFRKLAEIETLGQMPWAKVNTYYYDWTRFECPLTAAQFDEQFGRTRRVFDLSDDASCDRQTNAAVGSGVNEAFVAVGASIIAIGEGEAFSLNGADVEAPTVLTDTPALRIRDEITCNGYCGMVDLAEAQAANFATLWWGAPTWRFIEKFFQAYRLQILVNHRFQVVDESLLDVGMSPMPPEFVGASDSLIPTMPFIRAVNDVMQAKGIGRAFLVGNSVADTEAVSGSGCVPPPLASVTYGHPRIIGLANRIFPFAQPILFMPGMRFEVAFVSVEDDVCYRALETSVTRNCTTQHEFFRANVLSSSGDCGQSCTIPGGTVAMGVIFKGYALWPQACVEYLQNYLVPNSMTAQMYGSIAGNPFLAGLVQEHGELAGILRGAAAPRQ